MVYVGMPKSGGNEDIWKCFNEDDLAIPKHWEFATRTQKSETNAMQKMWFKAKAMAF